MPEFFDDDNNIICLGIGIGIIVVCLLIALIIFRIRSRSAAFDGSLFKNLEDEDWSVFSSYF